MNHLAIKLVKGGQAPHYPVGTQSIEIKEAVITEQGTEANLPIVDFVMFGEHGEKYVAVLTGRLILNLAAALRGVNIRNHGRAEP